jgi:adenine-specific DNA-methyltransferase
MPKKYKPTEKIEVKEKTKEELIAEIERLKKELKEKKRYGLVWEEKPEEVVDMCKKKLPIVKEVKSKETITDKNKPVNLLIEGDNYHALSVLNYTHEKKVDVIYIDPPYNTGKKDEWRYNDHYVDKEDTYRHSKWLSFMEKRLKLAKKLLKDTGVIFISVDDNEVAQLKLLVDDPDLFGENNLIHLLVWHSKYTVSNDAKFFSKQHEYVLCYARNINNAKINLLSRTEEANKRYSNPDNDSRGPWKSTPLHAKSGTKSNRYEFVFKNHIRWFPPEGRFPRFNQETLKRLEAEDRIWFGKDGKGTPSVKTFLSEVSDGIKAGSLLHYSIFGHTHKANEQLASVMGKGKFDNPKSVDLILNLIKLAETSKNSIVLDFMAGSGTSGQAVLDLNKEDGGNRQFILCTNNENNICTDVCYPRMQKVIEGYKNSRDEQIEGLGGNLKYFKTDFVDAEPTDKNKKKLTEQATGMLCIKEGTFEPVLDQKHFKIFKNISHYTGIIFDQLAIPEFKKAIKDIKGNFSVYVFSLSDETFDEEFTDIKQKVKLSPIPEAILRVYRRILR